MFPMDWARFTCTVLIPVVARVRRSVPEGVEDRRCASDTARVATEIHAPTLWV
jgi:hypothetical protein